MGDVLLILFRFWGHIQKALWALPPPTGAVTVCGQQGVVNSSTIRVCGVFVLS